MEAVKKYLHGEKNSIEADLDEIAIQTKQIWRIEAMLEEHRFYRDKARDNLIAHIKEEMPCFNPIRNAKGIPLGKMQLLKCNGDGAKCPICPYKVFRF